MAFLIDTHVFVWLATADRRLSKRVRDLLFSGNDEVMISVISPWELVLKQRNTAFRLPEPFEVLMARTPLVPLDLAFGTQRLVASLPDIHADPFDRMLIAQSLLHGLTLITGDEQIWKYPLDTFW